MSNSLVEAYRQRVPSDPRSDAELTDLFGQQNDQDGRYNQFTDFVSEYNSSKGPQGPDLPPRQPGFGEEFARGVSRGTSSLESTSVGLGALGAGMVGADRLKAAALRKYRDIEEQSAQDAPASVAQVEDINGPSTAARYILGKAGELVPNIAEAAAFGAAGAAAGTAVEPGGGTAAGGVGGVIEGFLARKAAKSALRALIDKGAELVPEQAARDLAKTELANLAEAGVGTLGETAKHLFEQEAGSVAKKYGANAANLVNFYAQGAGGEYGKLQGEGDAGTAAAIAGLGSAGSIFLPAAVTSKLFPSIGEKVANDYVRRLATDAVKEIPMAASGMGLMEVANIAADRYANPETRDGPLTKEELSRILNASVVGAMAGGAAAPLTAIRGPKAQQFHKVIEDKLGNPSDQIKVEMGQLKYRRENGQDTGADKSRFATLSPKESRVYAMVDPISPVAKPELVGESAKPVEPTATKGEEDTIEEPPPTPPEAKAPETPAGTGAPSGAPSPPPSIAQAMSATGATDLLYEKIFDAAVKGKSSVSGVKESLIGESAPMIKSGKFKSWQDIKDWVQAGKPDMSKANTVREALDSSLAAKRAAAAVSIAPPEDTLAKAAKAKVAAAAAQTDTTHSLKERLAGNYAKGKLDGADIGLPGLTISIETPKGTERKGIGPGGPWKAEMPADYGYFLGTKGRDKDHVDVSIGPNPTTPEVYVVDQVDPKTGQFDEHKTFVGFESKAQAEAAYDSSFSDGSGPQRRGAVTTMTKPELKDFLGDEARTKKPLKYAEPDDATLAENIFRSEGKASVSLLQRRLRWGYAKASKAVDALEKSGIVSPSKGAEARTVSPKGEPYAVSQPEPKPDVARSAQPEVAPKLEGAKAPVKEGGDGVPESRPGPVDKGPAQESAPAKEIGEVKEGQRVLSKEIPKTELQKKAEAAEAERKAKWEALKKYAPPDLGQGELLTSPLHSLKLDPELLKQVTALIASAIKEGAYKFAAFSEHFIKETGKAFASLVIPSYETMREEHPELKDRMDSLAAMNADGGPLDKFIARVKKKDTVIHPGDQPITIKDVDFAGHGTRDISGRGTDSPEVAKLWEEDRKSILEAYQNRNKRAKAELEARRTGKVVRAKLTPENYRTALQTAKWEDLSPDIKDVFLNALDETLTDQQKLEVFGKEIGADVKEPAYFTPKGGLPFAELARQLTSESAPESGAANTVTHRVVDIRDDETGKIHRVSIWEANRTAEAKPEDYVWVTKTDKAGQIFDGVTSKGREAVKLSEVMAARSKDGSNRYRIVGSLRTESPTKYYHSEYENREVYNKSFANEAKQAARAVQAGGRAEEMKLEQHGKESGSESVEDQFTGQEEEAPYAALGEIHYPSPQRDPKPLDLKANHLKAIRELPPFDTLDQLEALLHTPAITPEMEEAIHHIATKDPYFFSRVEETDLDTALKEWGYDIDSRESGQNEHAAAGPAQAGVHPDGPGKPVRESGSQTDLASGKNLPGAEGQAGAEGDQKSNRPTEAQLAEQQARKQAAEEKLTAAKAEADRLEQASKAASDKATLDRLMGRKESDGGKIKLRTPKGEPTAAQGAMEKVESIHRAAQRAGMNPELVRGELASGGWDPKKRGMTQTLGAVVGANDVKNAYHEALHGAFDEVIRANPELAKQLLRGVDRLTDDQLGIAFSEDPKISSANPAGLPLSDLNEERLVESVTQKFASEGIGPEQAKGYAQKFVRTLKEHILKAALAVQRMLGFKNNGQLARAYFENHARRLLAGDIKLQSYQDFVGARQMGIGRRYINDYDTANGWGERLNENGDLTYQPVREMRLADSAFNLEGIKYRNPDEVKESRKTDLELLVSPLNHKADVINSMVEALAGSKDLSAKLGTRKINDFVRSLAKISDPEESRKALDEEKETSGEKVKFNRDQRAADFKSKELQSRVEAVNYATVKGIAAALDKTKLDAEHAIRDLRKQSDLLTQKYEASKTLVKQYKSVLSDKTVVVPGLERKLTLETNKAAKARLDSARARRAVAREQLKIDSVEAIKPKVWSEYSRLAAASEVRPSFVFADKALVPVPDSPAATTEELKGFKHGKTLSLDSTGKVTNEQELVGWMKKQQAFLNHREELARNGDVNAKDHGYQYVAQALHTLAQRTAGGWDSDVHGQNRWGFTLNLLPETKALDEVVGSPSTRNVVRMFNGYDRDYTAMHNPSERIGRKTGQLERVLLGLSTGLDEKSLRDIVIDRLRIIPSATGTCWSCTREIKRGRSGSSISASET
jgi:hypothetical protein